MDKRPKLLKPPPSKYYIQEVSVANIRETRKITPQKKTEEKLRRII